MKKLSKVITVLGASVLLGISAPALSPNHTSASHVKAPNSLVSKNIKAQRIHPRAHVAIKSNHKKNNRKIAKSNRMFIASNNYGIYKNNWQKTSNTGKKFHHVFTVKPLKNGRYYNLYNHKHYIGYANKHALVNVNKNSYLNVPWISQYHPVFAPWGCSESSLAMLLDSKAGGRKHVNMKYIFAHTPKYPMKGGQVGNVYTGAGFGHVVTPAALTRYAHHWNKNVKNISGSSINQIKMYVQSGHPVLYYGYSSYQKPYDHNRNHCKVISGYRTKDGGEFRVNDPLYFSKYAGANHGGHNLMFDHGAISWLPIRTFNYEYAVVRGSNRKCALTV